MAGDAGSGRHGLPLEISPSLLYEVIEGVSMDLQPRPFASFEELVDYCYRVASVVGLCCIHIWGYRSDGGRAERWRRLAASPCS